MNIGDWDQLSALFEIEEIEQPKTILKKGQTNRNLYYILEGNAQVIIDPSSSTINRLENGEFFGEMSFLDRLPTTASVVAETGSRIARIDGDKLLNLCQSDPFFAERLYKYLALLLTRRLRKNIGIVREKNVTIPKQSEISHNQKIQHEGYEFRQLLTDQEIRSAMSLLHEIYFVEQKWTPQPFNPSRVRIEYDGEHGMLVDKFSDIAHWFGALHNGILVGCIRVLPYPALELKEYRGLPLFLTHSSVSELNRFAIHRAFRDSRFVALLLMRLACDHALSLGNVIYVTAVTPGPAELFEKLGLTRMSLPSFKYNMKEIDKVDLLFYDCRTGDPDDTTLYRVSSKIMERMQRGC